MLTEKLISHLDLLFMLLLKVYRTGNFMGEHIESEYKISVMNYEMTIVGQCISSFEKDRQ